MEGKRFIAFRENLEMTQGELARFLKIPQSVISQIENNVRGTSSNLMRKLADTYPALNINWLLTGKGDMYISNHNTPDDKILIAPIEAYAGVTVDWPQVHMSETPEFIHVPDAPKDSVIFPVSGDSMWPALNDKDWLVCTLINDLTELQREKIYVIITQAAGVLVKYIQQTNNGLLLVPHNKRGGYQNEILENKEVIEIWEVKMKITKHIFQTAFKEDSNDLQRRVAHLEKLYKKLGGDKE